MMKCGLCGHEREWLGGSADGQDLCHGCLNGFDCDGSTEGVRRVREAYGRSCYERWTVYKERPPAVTAPTSGSPAESVCGCGHGQNDHNHNGTGVCYFGETEHECYCMKFWHAEASTPGSPAESVCANCRQGAELSRGKCALCWAEASNPTERMSTSGSPEQGHEAIQRLTWDAYSEFTPSDNGDYVTYADHVAAIRAERERAAERVAALERESEVQLWSDIIAAARGGSDHG